jgi:NAD(P)-dependent dehydrogenase (short-subunit alcohol dehydrogenase family)
MLLKNSVAIITGGARGIGKGIAQKFAQEGSSVVIADLVMAEAQKALSDISGKGKGLAVKCDVSDSKQVKQLVAAVIEKYGKVDILVNNAGFGPPSRPFADIPEEEWDKTIAVNLKGVFLCCQAVIPHMKKKGYGRIINISSGMAVSPAFPMAHYVSAKAGVLGMTKDLALELAPFKICVNAILPGPVRTELWNSVVPPDADKDAFFAEVGEKIVPMKRVGMPEDIASVALFLASELSRFVTGEEIHVGGGLPLRYQR